MTAVNATLLMDNLSERGNPSPEGNNIKSLSCDK